MFPVSSSTDQISRNNTPGSKLPVLPLAPVLFAQGFTMNRVSKMNSYTHCLYGPVRTLVFFTIHTQSSLVLAFAFTS
jgi:hypothetical protein